MRSSPLKNIGFALLVCGLSCVGPLTVQAAVINGKVIFEGEVPAPKPLNFGAEKQCAVMHGDKMPVTEDLVVNPNQTVKWALVYIKEGAPASTAPTPGEAVEINQKGCMFEPHAVVARIGQKVIFRNSDPLLHNVRSESKVEKPFNIAQPLQDMTTAKTFAQPEIGIKMRCDVHFWMASYVHVLDHPFYAVTGDDGSFQIKDLPAGTYTIEVWHEKLGTQTAEITVAEGETKTSEFALRLS
ncbi:MAG: carboxypeptidase regulatory-like domain-containing protein [Candidatus Omnitrophica bacterium]|nr:carboxypeptidase regulatory-like domain-containing protein [Candidatus Omnitrophota bacterium]